MSILSDRQIRELSFRPNYKTHEQLRTELFLSDEFSLDKYADRPNPTAMRLFDVNDRATELHNAQDLPMIYPFEEGQVRERDARTLESLMVELGASPLNLDARAEAQRRLDQMIADGTMPKEKIVSYGTSSYGYDVRCAPEFKIFTNINSTIVDPKHFDEKCFVDVEGPECIIPPNSFALARTVEYFRIPRDVLVVCLGKSTYARCGIIVNVTPLEPEWEGHVTLEFSNTTPLPARIYAGEGVAQMLFFRGSEPCETSYKDRKGKYQGQTGVTIPKV